MTTNNKYTFRKFLVMMAWIILISGTVVLLVAAISKKNNERCVGLEINISGVQNNFFIDKTDVISILEKANGGKLERRKLHTVNLSLMETELKKSKWIKNAELFFDNNNVLQVRVTEREPIARIFTTSGLSFYIDSSLARLPLSDKFSARLPVFTDFPTDVIVLSKKDSGVLKGIKMLSEFINLNPFWMAQIDQVDIASDRTFDLIPKLGNQVIYFGDAENYQEKFGNLLCFYKQVLSKVGWARYSSLSVQFKGQVVGVRKGANEIKMDSIRSIQVMKSLIAEAQKRTNDSTNVQLAQPDDDNSNINISNEIKNIPNENWKQEGSNANDARVPVTSIPVTGKPVSENKNITKKVTLSHHSPSVEKPNPNPLKSGIIKYETPKKIENEKRKPKAVMPAKTDY